MAFNKGDTVEVTDNNNQTWVGEYYSPVLSFKGKYHQIWTPQHALRIIPDSWISGSSGLDFSALSALPASRRSSVETAANAAAIILGVEPQSIIDALALGRGFYSGLPDDGCNLASSGGAVTSQGDPVGAIQSWTGEELAVQANASLQPTSNADGLHGDGTEWMEGIGGYTTDLDTLSLTFLFGSMSAGDTCLAYRSGGAEFFTIAHDAVIFRDSASNLAIFLDLPTLANKIVYTEKDGIDLVKRTNDDPTEGRALTTGLIRSSVVRFFGDRTDAAATATATLRAFHWSETLMTADQQAAVREFTKLYFLDFSGLPNLPVSRQSAVATATNAAALTLGVEPQSIIDALASASLWIDAFSTYTDVAGTTPAVTGDPIAAALDNITGDLFTQNNAVARPTLGAGPVIIGDYAKALSGTATENLSVKTIYATTDGILVVDGTIPAFFPIRILPNLTHFVVGDFTTAEIEKIKAFCIAEGATDNAFTGVSNFADYFRLYTNITGEFPASQMSLSSYTGSMTRTFFGSGITGFESVTLAGSSYNSTWRNCNDLTNFPASVFDNCNATDFFEAFVNTDLTQTSIDNILVSIESNGTSNGTFSQSTGSAPSAVGEAAIDALRARGWTVTVTGGY